MNEGRLTVDCIVNDLRGSGPYRITGSVDKLGVAGAYLVRLYERDSGRPFAQVWSDPSGAYSFPSLPYRERGYFAVSFDHGANPVNAAVADLITPEPM